MKNKGLKVNKGNGNDKSTKKKAEVDNNIYVVLNTEPLTVQNHFTKKGKKFFYVDSERKSKRIPHILSKYKDKALLGFANMDLFFQNIDYVKSPPIVWEKLLVVRNLSLLCQVRYLDAQLMQSGLVIFSAIDYEAISESAKLAFKSKNLYTGFKKSKHKWISNGSELNEWFNSFLITLPHLTYEPFFVAITKIISNRNLQHFIKFADDNRLITNLNQSSFEKFYHRMEHLKPYFPALIKKEIMEFKTPMDKLDIKFLKLLVIKYQGVNIKDFGHKEINSRSEDSLNAKTMGR